jgi:hypothetical protein
MARPLNAFMQLHQFHIRMGCRIFVAIARMKLTSASTPIGGS